MSSTKAVAGCCGLVDPAMGPDEAAAVAVRFKALADPTRLRMLNLLLRNGELCVCDLHAQFDLSQPTISHHLSLLRKAGLVRCEVRGRWAWYSAEPGALGELADVLEVTRP